MRFPLLKQIKYIQIYDYRAESVYISIKIASLCLESHKISDCLDQWK